MPPKHDHSHKHFDKLKLEKLPSGEAEIIGELTLPFLAECRGEALKALGERTKIDGFRAGHIPEATLTKHVGEMHILEEVAEVGLAHSYGHIISELKLSPIGRPRVAITKLAPGIPLEFKITVTLEPEFDLPDYKKIANGVPAETLKDDAKEDEKFWAKEKRRAAVVEELVKNTNIKLPKMLVDSELERMLAQFKSDVSGHGMKWDEYLKSINKTDEDVRKDFDERAENRVKAEMIMVKIAEKEKIEPSLEELEAEAKHLMGHHPEADPLRIRLYVFQLIRNSKVLEFLETQ